MYYMQEKQTLHFSKKHQFFQIIKDKNINTLYLLQQTWPPTAGSNTGPIKDGRGRQLRIYGNNIILLYIMQYFTEPIRR